MEKGDFSFFVKRVDEHGIIAELVERIPGQFLNFDRLHGIFLLVFRFYRSNIIHINADVNLRQNTFSTKNAQLSHKKRPAAAPRGGYL